MILHTYYARHVCVCTLEKKLKWDISTWEMLFEVRVSLLVSGYLWLNSILMPFFRFNLYALSRCFFLSLFLFLPYCCFICVELLFMFAFNVSPHKIFTLNTLHTLHRDAMTVSNFFWFSAHWFFFFSGVSFFWRPILVCFSFWMKKKCARKEEKEFHEDFCVCKE